MCCLMYTREGRNGERSRISCCHRQRSRVSKFRRPSPACTALVLWSELFLKNLRSARPLAHSPAKYVAVIALSSVPVRLYLIYSVELTLRGAGPAFQRPQPFLLGQVIGGKGGREKEGKGKPIRRLLENSSVWSDMTRTVFEKSGAEQKNWSVMELLVKNFSSNPVQILLYKLDFTTL